MFKKLGLGIFLLLMVITGTVQAQNMLYKEIQQAHSKGYLFQEVNLFNEATGEKHEALAKETLLTPDTKAIKNLYEDHLRTLHPVARSHKIIFLYLP